MKPVIQLFQKLVSFLGGLFIGLGANQFVGFLMLPFTIVAGLSASHTDRVQRIATVLPFINLAGLLLTLFVAYLIIQLNTDKLFRRGVVIAVVLCFLAAFGNIFR